METCEAPSKRISRRRGTCIAHPVCCHKGKSWRKRNISMQKSLLFSLGITASTLVHIFLNQLVTIRHRASKSARHDDGCKLYSHVLKMRATRCPCGSRDNAELYRNTKPPVSASPGPRVAAKRVLTLQFNHSNESPVIDFGAGAGGTIAAATSSKRSYCEN